MIRDAETDVNDYLASKGLAYVWVDRGDRYGPTELETVRERAYRWIQLHRLGDRQDGRNNREKRQYSTISRKFEADTGKDPEKVLEETEETLEVLGDLKRVVW